MIKISTNFIKTYKKNVTKYFYIIEKFYFPIV